MDFPKFIYVFDKDTGEFITKKKIENQEYYDKLKILSNVTEIAPPEEKDGYIRIFNNGNWSYERETI